MWKGGGCHNVSKQEYFCPPSLLETSASDCYAGMSHGGGVWSVTLVAKWREFILVIQTDRALSELVLWDELALLGSSILRVTWGEKGGGKGFRDSLRLIAILTL